MRTRPERASYPEPPWSLRSPVGFAWVGLGSADTLRQHLPAGLELLTLPGGTAPVAIAAVRYDEGSTLAYSELLVGTAVRAQGRSALHVLQLYVDDDRSLRAGRERWALPKERASFQWETRGEPGSLLARSPASRELTITRGTQVLLQAWWLPRGPAFPVARSLPALSVKEGAIAPWAFEARARVRLAMRHLTVPAGSPLELVAPRAAAMLDLSEVALEIPAPSWS